jgi:acyl-CoA thioester hydrolase
MHEVKIYYHDTDCGGVVYYANYLKYFEQARTEFFAACALSVKELACAGTWFVVARQEADYKSSAGYGDILQIQTRITRMTSVRIEFAHEALRQGHLVCSAKTVLVCVDKDLKPRGIPDDVKEKLANCREAAHG